MKQEIFNKRVKTLIKEAVDAHKRYEEIFKSRYNIYLEYETGTRERRIELLSLTHQGDDDLEMYFDKIADLGNCLNKHDFDIALRKINKEIISDQKLWDDYFEWKSNRSTKVVQPGSNPDLTTINERSLIPGQSLRREVEIKQLEAVH